MTDLFQAVLNMSITGAYISVALILLRLLMKRLPRRYSYMLWAILALRLICPFSFSSVVSLFNAVGVEPSGGSMSYVPHDIGYAAVPEVNVGVPAISSAVNSILPPAELTNSVNPMQLVMSFAAIVWLAGIAVLLTVSVVSYLRVRRRVSSASLLSENIYVCESIDTPFVFGIIKPRIYVPQSICESDLQLILAHERAHISRGDHVIKLLAFLTLTLHWFNPFVWVSFRLMSADMERSCDERALAKLGNAAKKDYAAALLNISLKQNHLPRGGLLAFGESNIKSRIKGVLSARKPTVIVSVIAVMAVILAAACLLTNANAKPQESLLTAAVNSDYGSYTLIRGGDEHNLTAAQAKPFIDKLRTVTSTRVGDGTTGLAQVSGDNSVKLYDSASQSGNYLQLALISGVDNSGRVLFCIDIMSTNTYHIYEVSESDWSELNRLFSLCFEGNDGEVQTTAPAVSEPVLSETSVPEIPALNLIDCYINAEGEYFINSDEWQQSADYELFKQYFFGAWKGSFCFPEGPEQESLIIDDSEKSFVMTETEIRILDGFYETGSGALAFIIGNYCGNAILWLNSNEPDTMYMAWGDSTSPLRSRNENGEYSTVPIIYSLRKTDVPLNEPADNFLSIFKLREMAQTYGIDYDMLVKLEYQCEAVELALPLLHDDYYQLYPVYLVSEAADKLTLKTSVGNVYYRAVLGDVTYTLEKIGGEWKRTVEFGFTEDEMSCMITADCAAEAYLQTNRDALARYLVSGYEVLDDSAEYLYGRVTSMNLRIPAISTAENDAVYTVTCVLMFDGSDMLSYLDMGLIKTADGWRVSSITLQG